MTGQEVFFWCLGVASIIVALALAAAIPQALKMIERITLADPKYRPPVKPYAGAPPRPGAPWGDRPNDGDTR
jgi:hypothetical protein